MRLVQAGADEEGLLRRRLAQVVHGGVDDGVVLQRQAQLGGVDRAPKVLLSRDLSRDDGFGRAIAGGGALLFFPVGVFFE